MLYGDRAMGYSVRSFNDIIEPHLCAISYEQLMEFADTQFKDHYRSNLFGYPKKTMRHVVQDIIKPVCEEHGTAYSLHLNPDGLCADTFVTHCWDEPFVDFVESIRRLFHPFVNKPNLWICSFALNQGTEEVQEALDVPSLDQSPFILALSQATKFVVVRNAKVDLYSRLWCVCELMFASRYGFTAKAGKGSSCKETLVTGPNNMSSNISVAEAETSNPKDKEKILQLLDLEFEVDYIDDMVKEYRQHGSYHSTVDHMFRHLHSTSYIGMMLLVLGILCLLIFSIWFLALDPVVDSKDPKIKAALSLLFGCILVWMCWLVGWLVVPYCALYDVKDSFLLASQRQTWDSRSTAAPAEAGFEQVTGLMYEI